MSAYQNDSNDRSFLSRLKRRFFRPDRRIKDERESWNQRLVHSLARTRFPSWRQIRHLPEVLSSNDALRLQIGSVLVLVGLVIFGGRFYFAHTKIVPAVGGSMAEGVVGTPRSLNPILAVSNDVDQDIVRLTYSSLFADDGTGGLEPDLVSSYDISADQKTYVFRLQDAKWTDGQALTADDILYTVALIQDPSWKSPLQSAFRDVTAEKIDARTVRFALKQPLAPFLSDLTFGILPQHVWKDVGPQDVLQAEANLKPIGSGPFQFADLQRDNRGFVLSYTLKRNPKYYRQPPYLDELSFHFYPDYPSSLDALKKHDVDSLGFVPNDLRTGLASVSHIVTASLDLPQYQGVFFNAQQNSALADPQVRRALATAVNTDRILLDVLHGTAKAISGPPLPGASATATPTYDPARAGQLLDAAGWPIDTADGIRKKAPKQAPAPVTTKKKKTTAPVAPPAPLKVTLTIIDQPEARAVADIIKQGWAAIGVDVEVNAVAPADMYRSVIQPRAYEALLYGQLLGADPDPYPFWHSSQVNDPGQNLAMFSNRQADAAIMAARAAADQNVRETQYGIFLQILADQAPAVFLYSPTYAYPLPSDLKGFGGTRIAIPSDRFATVTSWYLKTTRAWK